jgi:hypothetical protein
VGRRETVEQQTPYRSIMLTSVLPGFREVRTPLIVGYLYLLCIWIWFGESRLVPEHPSNTFTQRISDAIDRLGTPAFSVALSVTAFLIGALLTLSVTILPAPSNTLSQASGLRMWVSGLVREKTYEQGAHDRVQKELLIAPMDLGFQYEYSAADDADRTKFGDLVSDDDPKVVTSRLRPQDHQQEPLAEVLTNRVVDEFDILLMRLRTRRPAVWDEYDRLTSEAELRMSIVLPLCVLCGEAVRLWTWWALVGYLGPFLLLTQGLLTAYHARQVVWNAVATGAIESPIVERFMALRFQPMSA